MSFLPPLDVLARLPLLPVMLLQGILVRRRAIVLPEAAGARQGVVGTGQPLRLLILGDSSAAGVGVEIQQDALSGQVLDRLARSRTVHWRLVARTGATTSDAAGMLQEVSDDTFDVAVLVFGVNDAVRLKRLGPWRRQHAALRQMLRDEFGVTTLLVTAVPPLSLFPALPRLLQWILGAHAERMDRALAEDVRKEAGAFHYTLDLPFSREAMAIDGYHPSASTYALWGRTVAERILAVVSPSG
ncbi:SGNH/GDSL hydrolase family protein [Planktotalea sp.]|uniref:SGNH/GDSL hydrolase family protein n=1 Tax=Planktotalea sp. TaxID=2029877 RepID=UPI003D6A743F